MSKAKMLLEIVQGKVLIDGEELIPANMIGSYEVKSPAEGKSAELLLRIPVVLFPSQSIQALTNNKEVST